MPQKSSDISRIVAAIPNSETAIRWKGAHPITSHEKYPHDRYINPDDSIKKTSSYPHHSPVLPIKCHSKSVNPCTVNPIISQYISTHPTIRNYIPHHIPIWNLWLVSYNPTHLPRLRSAFCRQIISASATSAWPWAVPSTQWRFRAGKKTNSPWKHDTRCCFLGK